MMFMVSYQNLAVPSRPALWNEKNHHGEEFVVLLKDSLGGGFKDFWNFPPLIYFTGKDLEI